MRILVTGGAGFIGRHLVRRLVKLGHHVGVLDDLSSGDRNALPPSVRFVHASILDADVVRREVSQCDVIFHLAAVASVSACISNLVESHRVNVTGFLTLIEAARLGPKLPKFVYASSAAVYGDRSKIAAESDALSPLSPYGADKASMELHARAAGVVYGIQSIGLRFFNVYGPEQRPDSHYSGVISIFANRLLLGRELTIHGDGKQSRDFVYVTDVVDALIRAADFASINSPVVNVCTGVETSVSELAEAIASQADVPLRTTSLPARLGDIPVSIGDPSLAKSLLGFSSAVDIDSGLNLLLRSL